MVNGGYQRYRVLWPLVPAMAMVTVDSKQEDIE
jgi:hypothetical protein